jgi:hypothetical protein
MMKRRTQPQKKMMRPKLMPLLIDAEEMPAQRKDVPPSKTVRQTPKGYVEVVGAGSAPSGARFVKTAVNGKELIIPANDLLGSMIIVHGRLQNLGAVLVESKDQKDLETRIKTALQAPDTFSVATRLGWFRPKDAHGKNMPAVFVLPHGTIPDNPSIEIYLDEPDNDAYQRLQTKGTLEQAMQWLKLADGNRYAMFGLSLACLGPIGSYLGFEHVGMALVSGSGKLKTTMASMFASFFGGDDDPINQLASGASLRQTDFNYEKLCVGRSSLALVLNEADCIEGRDQRSKDYALFKLIKDVAEGRAKGRGIDPHLKLWFAPLVITSNESIVAVHKRIGRPGDFSYLDRMFDMVLAAEAACFFENLHGSADPTAFRERLVALLRAYYGTPGWEFIRRVAEWIAKDESGFRNFVKARQKAYLRSARKIKAPGRDARLFNKHASVYAAGCVGIKLGILPFKQAALLGAILSCQREHVAFVARELGLRSSSTPVEGNTLESDIRKVRRHLRRGLPQMINMEKTGACVPRGHDHFRCIGYRGRHDDRREIWVPFPAFKRVLGGSRSRVRAVQDELHRRGLLSADEGPSGNREYSVKRLIPGVGRQRVIAFRYRPK